MSNYDQASGDGYVEKLVYVGRTAKVVKGGRIFKFNAVVVVGEPNKGLIGFGTGKAGEVPLAIQKAMEKARRNMQQVELNGTTLWYQVTAHHGASEIFMKPAAEGTGIIAGGAMRAVFEVLGVQNILAKCRGSRRPVNVIRATINGLVNMNSPEHYANKRGKMVHELVGKKKNEQQIQAS